MNRLLLVGVAVSLIGLAGPAAAQKPDKNATLSIAVSPTIVTFGNSTGISGQLSTKQQNIALILEAQPHPFTGKWDEAGRTNTGADGNYSFSHKPSINTRYRVVTDAKPAVRSAEQGVQVRWKVGLGVSDRTPRKGARVRFSGWVKPAHPNGPVLIQKRTSAGWKTVKTTLMRTVTTSASKYSTRLRIRRNGRYRAVVEGNGARETGISRVRRLVVH